MNIGVVGIGRMGRAIVERYSKNDYKVFGWNRTREKIRDLRISNLTLLDKPREVCEKTKMIYLTLADEESVKEVLFMKEGLLDGLTSDHIILNITTITPKAAREFNKIISDKGAKYIDLPVLGSPNKIRKGTLPMLFGGDKNLLEQLKPHLKVMGDKIIFVGEVGKASALKLIFNMVLPSIVVLLSEALNIGRKAGLSDELVIEALMESPLKAAIERYYDRLINPNPPVTFTMNLMLKDLEYLTRMAYNLRIPVFIAPVVKNLLESAIANGYGETYYAKIHDYLKKLSGLGTS